MREDVHACTTHVSGLLTSILNYPTGEAQADVCSTLAVVREQTFHFPIYSLHGASQFTMECHLPYVHVARPGCHTDVTYIFMHTRQQTSAEISIVHKLLHATFNGYKYYLTVCMRNLN